MSDAVWVAVASGLFTLVGSAVGALRAGKMTSYRVEQLEQKVDRFGSLVERMVAVEQSTRSAHKRISQWERKE